MVYVSRYEEKLKEGLDKALSEIPETHRKLIEEITDKITNEIHEQVRAATVDYLAEAIKDDLLKRAADMAESMLMNALAGDNKEIRNLFGFNDWYMKNLYVGRMPREWTLLDALIERKPELFRDEKIKQQAVEIEQLRKEVARIKNYWEGYEVSHHEGDYVTLRKKEQAA